jgi:integrase
VPFNEAALDVVTRQQGKHPLHVFAYEGNQVKQVSTRAWYKALRRAGIEAFRFHDLRHTWRLLKTRRSNPVNVSICALSQWWRAEFSLS